MVLLMTKIIQPVYIIFAYDTPVRQCDVNVHTLILSMGVYSYIVQRLQYSVAGGNYHDTVAIPELQQC